MTSSVQLKSTTCWKYKKMNEASLQTTAPNRDRHDRLKDAVSTVNQIVMGKDQQVKLAFSCLLARGHLLIEDLPGVGKTTLAHALAAVIGVRYQRIQFTSDLLPADILGVSIYRRDQEKFEFHPGPIFSQLVLADEINRATPKSQSALLEAMAEARLQSKVRRIRCQNHFSLLPRKTRLIWEVPSPCPTPNWTVSF